MVWLRLTVSKMALISDQIRTIMNPQAQIKQRGTRNGWINERRKSRILNMIADSHLLTAIGFFPTLGKIPILYCITKPLLKNPPIIFSLNLNFFLNLGELLLAKDPFEQLSSSIGFNWHQHLWGRNISQLF